MRGHPLRGGRVEQVGGVLQRARQGVPALDGLQEQVELGRPRLRLERAQGEPGEPQLLRRGVLQHQHRLEERVPPQAPLQAELLHHLLEGDVLVRVRPQHLLPDPAQEPAEVRGTRQVGAHGQGVDEEADHLLQRRVGPPGDGGPHHHVVLPGPARQEELPRGQERHERRRPLAARQGAQGGGGGLRDLEAQRQPLAGAAGGAWAVGGELQERGGARQAGAPVREAALQRFPDQPLPLPEGVVDVADRERRESGRLPGERGGVERAQVAEHDGQAPPVGDDVVGGEEEDVLVPREAEEEGAQERLARQVEGAARLLPREPRHGRLALRLRERGQVGGGERDAARGEHPLHGAPPDRGEDGPQRLVPLRERVQRPPQGAHLQPPAHPEAEQLVVRGAPGVQHVHHPEPLLGEGERPVPLDRAGEQGRDLGLPAARPVHLPRQRLQRGGVEDRPDGDLHPQDGADAGGHPPRQERVPAQLEEVVRRAHALRPQQLRPDPGQHLLRRRARRHVPAGGLRGRERLPVHLPRGPERKRLQHHQRGGDHVLREPLPQPRPQLRRGGGAPALGDDVPDQPGASRVLAGHHRGVPHGRVAGQHALHLAGLDAESADLDLRVHAPQELQRPVLAPAHPVAGAVRPRPRLRGGRVGDEALRRQLRPPQVAARHPGAADPQLPRLAVRERLAPLAADVQRHAGVRAPHQPPLLPRARRDGDAGAQDGGLGGAVQDVRPRPRERRAHGLQQLRGDGVPAHQRAAQPRERAGAVRRGGGHLAHQRGHRVQHRHVLQLPHQRLHVAHPPARDQANGAPRQEGGEGLEEPDVEGEGGQRRPRVLRADPEPRHAPRQGMGEGAVLHLHALGGARGARGVDDVRQALRVRVVHRPERPVLLLRVQEEHLRPVRREEPGQLRKRQNHRRRHVLQHEAQPLRGVGRVERDEGAAGLPGPQHPRHQLRPVPRAEHHRGLRPHAPRAQPPRDPLRPRVQLRVGHHLRPGAQRHGFRRERRPPCDGTRRARVPGRLDRVEHVERRSF